MIESKYKVGDVFVYIANPIHRYEILEILPDNRFKLRNLKTSYTLKLGIPLHQLEADLRPITKLEKALI